MSDAAERALARLDHEGVLEPEGAVSAAGRLGLRNIKIFRCVYIRELAELEEGLAGAKTPSELALRGRVRRLRGNQRGARSDLARAVAASPRDARALAWLGELDAVAAPRRAVRVLERAARLAPDDGLTRMWLGRARLELNQVALALRDLDAAMTRFPRPPSALLLLRAVALIHARDLRGAAAAAAKLDDAWSSASFVLLSLIRHRQGRAREAMEACHQARNIDLNVGSSVLLEHLGGSIWADPPRYLKRLNRAIARRPSALMLAERGELKRDPRLCLYAEALEDYEAAARLAPRVAWIHALVGRARNNASGGEAGLADFDRAISLAPESGWIFAWRGAILARLGRVEAALADFNAAASLMPWYPYTYAWRGAQLIRAGRHAEACADLDRAVALDPDYGFSYFERFKARLGVGQLDGAVVDLVAAHRADPKFEWPSDPRGRESLRRAARSRPDLGWLRAWNGRALASERRAKLALAEFGAAVRALPGAAEPRVWRGQALAQLGRMAEARRDFEEAVRLSPRAWSAHKALADLLASQGRTKEALASMRRVTALAPTTVAYLVDRARLESALSLTKAALRSLEKALELEPRYAAARALAARARWVLGDMAGAERDAEAALESSDPPAIAYVVRGSLRGSRGDLAGQAEDFRRAARAEPGLFTPEERRAIDAAAFG